MSNSPQPKPTIRVLLHDLLAVIEGRTMTVLGPDGVDVDLRLFDAEEFLEHQHELVDRLGHGSKVTPYRARDLTTPLRVTKAVPVE